MKIKWVIPGISFIILSLLLVGCGIPHEQYYATIAERDKTVSELQIVKTKLAETEKTYQTVAGESVKVKAELESAKIELEDTEETLQTTQKELQLTQTELENTKEEMETTISALEDSKSIIQNREKSMLKAKTFAELLSSTFVPPIKGKALTRRNKPL